MIKRKSILFLLLYLLALPVTGDAFFWNKPDTLATINGATFTSENFVHWWTEWQEPGMSVPENPQEYVDWMVLFQEAERMRLFENSSYREKIAVFLKVRSLMLLKNEEIAEKIRQPSKEDLEQYYLENYVPIMELGLLKIPAQDKAKQAQDALPQAKDLYQLAELTGLPSDSTTVANMGKIRPLQLPGPFRTVTAALQAGEIGGPVPWDGAWYFLQVKNKDAKTLEGFDGFESDLRSKWLRNEENRLTGELIKKLKRKFNVSIDEDVLQKIGPAGVADDIADKPVIVIAGQSINAATLYKNVSKDQKMRGHQRMGNQNDFSVGLRRVAADIVAQTVTSLEAAERHYEKEPPLQPIYQFYCQHRMIKELEKELLWNNVKVTDKDVEAFYTSHPEKFARSELAELAMVQTREKDLAKDFADRLKEGEDFFKVLAPLSPRGIAVQKLPVDHLPEAVRKALDTLAPGQVSGAINDGDDIYFIKLVRTMRRDNVPLSEVAGSIKDQLVQERFQSLRKNLVKELRVRSEISVNQNVWLKLHDQLLEENHGG